ncbi:MAG: hypothetical protein KA369_15700 [Spirochaetes bacterium]|nr:hypothetical protein [Spirochaetota bacterium]
MPLNLMMASAVAIIMAFWACSCSESAADPRCAELEKRFDRVLGAAGGLCSADSDCACYGQSTTASKCGGVTDGKAAAALAAIGNEFHALKCPRNYRCAPWKCVPVCHKGKCVTDLLKRSMEKNPGR